MMPLALLALGMSYRTHHQPLALALGALAVAIAYAHVFGGTPEWTMYFVLTLSVIAAVADWLAGRWAPPRTSSEGLGQIRL